jgi:aspartyl-tRNA(Asn)/glutamyl-tRNA(Gln) amidotransferase subunit C
VIERSEVLHVARLARLSLDETELEVLAGELSSILDHIDRLAEISIDGVEPTTHVVPLGNVFRDDVATPGLDRETALGQAPDSADGAFRVPSPQAEA